VSSHRILYVIPGLRQGGAERQLLELVRRLPPRFAPTICVYDGEGIHYRDELPAGEPRHVLGVRRMSWRGLDRLARVIDDERPSILHSYRDRANLWTRLALRRVTVRPPVVITSVRNRNVDALNLLTERRLARGTDRILTNSEGVRGELVRRVRLPADRIDVIPNFVDVGKFHPPSPGERTTARRRWELGDDELALLVPARLSLQKHQVGLMLALRRLRRAGRLPARVRVLLAGRDRDVLYSRLVRALARGVPEVRFLGAVNEMTSLYHAADAVLLPSLFEGMPNAVIEAHACGLPVLASQAANADGLVIHGQTGLVVPTADRQALAEAIAALIGMDAATRARLGERGREHVTRRLDPTVLLGSFVTLYDRLLAEKGLTV
jgi:glycosyltransferase involved in cell wall biosynthesis